MPTMHGLSLVLFMCYMLVVIIAMHLAMGTIGFLSSAAFVISMFSHVNAEGERFAPEGRSNCQ
jgi:hypothetical protein